MRGIEWLILAPAIVPGLIIGFVLLRALIRGDVSGAL